MKSNPPGALALLLKKDPALCQQLQDAVQSFTLPKEKAPKKAEGAHCEALDPGLSEQLQLAMESLGLQPKEKRPEAKKAPEQVTLDTRSSSPVAAEPTSQWSAKDIESCVAKTLNKLERPRKAAERLIGDLLPELSLPQPWVTYRSSKGKLFFLNPVSRTTTWRHPLEPALQDIGVLCKSLLELDDAWRLQLLKDQKDIIDQEELEGLSSWRHTAPGHWQHSEGQTSSTDPSTDISASAECKRLAVSKLQDSRYLSELLFLEPPALPKPKSGEGPSHFAKAIQLLMQDDDSSCTVTPPATGRSQATPSHAQLPPTNTQKSGESEAKLAMASDGLMTFSLSEQAKAGDGGAEEATGSSEPKAGVAKEAEDLPSSAADVLPRDVQHKQADEPKAPKEQVQNGLSHTEDLRSEGSGAEVEQLMQQLVADGPQGLSGPQSREGGAASGAAEADTSGLAQLLQQVSEILAVQMQGTAGDKKATSSRSKELAGVPQAKAEAASVPPGPTKGAVEGSAMSSELRSKVEELQGDSGKISAKVSQPQAAATLEKQVKSEDAQPMKSLSDFDPTDPSKEERVVDYVTQHLQLLDVDKTGRISPGKLCWFFEMLGMDVHDLTQALAASNQGQDGTVDYAAFVRWLMTSGCN